MVKMEDHILKNYREYEEEYDPLDQGLYESWNWNRNRGDGDDLFDEWM